MAAGQANPNVPSITSHLALGQVFVDNRPIVMQQIWVSLNFKKLNRGSLIRGTVTLFVL